MSSHLVEDDKKYVWHPFTQHQTSGDPLPIVKAKDTLLYDAEGKAYIDANSCWWVNIHGHGNEHIRKAIYDQYAEIDHVIFANVTHQKGVEVAKRVIHYLGEPFQKVFFSDNGSTAVEVALKMAMQFWYNKRESKPKIIAIDGAYHGDTFGAMAVGDRGGFNTPFEPYLFHVDFLDFPSAEKEEQVLDQLERLLEKGDVAAFIFEPLVLGSGGMKMYSADFLDKALSLCKKYEVLTIADEIMTGWGRTGKLFAIEYISERPDLVCLSKGVTGGVLPLGLTVATQEIFDMFLGDSMASAMLHGHSFTGNSLICAAVCANFDLIDQPAFFNNINRIVNAHRSFSERLKIHPKVKNVRQSGTIFAFDVVQETEGYFSSLRDKIISFYRENGILLRPLGNTIFFNAPFCITDAELQQLYDVTERFLEEV